MSESSKPVGRTCGPCTACCDGWLLAEIEGRPIRPGTPCQHVIPGGGCGIYERRPENPCRLFTCGWLQHPELLDDDLRPDLCGTIAILDRDWNGWEVIQLVPTGESVPPATLERFKSKAVKIKRALTHMVRSVEDGRFTGQQVLGYGPPAFAEQVKSRIMPEDVFMGHEDTA